MSVTRSTVAWFTPILFILLAGCSPIVKDGQPTTNASTAVLRSGETVGQTFSARDRGLDGVEVFFSPDALANGEIRLHLRANSQSTTDVAMGTIVAQTVTAPGFYRFDFAPQNNSREQDYYLAIELQGSGAFRIGTALGDTYLDGALYQNGNPVDAQMAFWLVYDPVEFSIGLLSQMAAWLRILAVAILFFVLPGWAIIGFFYPNWAALCWGEKLGLATGVSLAIYPIIFLWTHVVGLHLGIVYAWAPAIVAVGVLGWRNRTWRPIDLTRSWSAWRQSNNVLPDLALVILIGMVFGVRLWITREINMPMWGDSYQHSMITQLLVDQGGLFTSWQPYADLVTFTYHFGFHSLAAVFHWGSAMDVPQSVLLTGQILNGLSVLALYPLARRVGANRWAGVGAVLIAGLLSPMPMYYVNWGRYTQLAGQVILPIAICLTWTVMETRSWDWRLAIGTWIVWGGMALTHYRILIFAILFFVAYVFIAVWKNSFRELTAKVVGIGIGGGLLFLPWFINSFGGRITLGFLKQLTTAADAVSSFTIEYNGVGELTFFLPMALWGLLLLGIVWGLLRKDKGVIVVGLWWLLVLFAANPQWFRLPGEGALTNFAVLIATYIPASILIGAATSWLVNSHRRNVSLAVCALAILGGFVFVPQRVGDVRVEQGALVTRPDLRAADWIQANIPPSSRFLVNSFFAYGNALIVGSDGGWWLPLLAYRQTTLPPLNYGSEKGARPDYREWINAVQSMIEQKGIAQSETLALLRAHGITHIYIGQRQGHVNNPGTVLLPEQLLADEHFHPVYHQDRVWIFELRD